MARQTGPTKAELQATLDQVTEALQDALDPRLSREDVVTKISELNDSISGDEDDEDEDDEDEYEEDDEDE